jgi:glycosyltransferase involved in cell wall biosynthesis
MPSPTRPVIAAIDATPLLGARTGVGASVAGAIPELGDAALLVGPRDVPALAEALLTVATEETVRQRLIAAGTERVSLCTWQRGGRQLEALYRVLADAHA